jgi:hypothetical protein
VPTWEEFGGQLATVLAEIVDGDQLIISADQPPGVYVQAAQDDAELTIEAVADHHLPPESRAGAAGAERLRALGWNEPEDEFENWADAVDWPAPTADYARAADMMVATLRDVYSVPDPTVLTYRAWNHEHTPSEKQLPRLGIARVSG